MTRGRRLLAAIATAGALGAALLAPTRAAPPASPTLPLHACRLPGLEHDAQCGSLRRPLDPARPDGPQIELQVAVLPALARQKKPDPVFFFAGGPGQGAIALAGQIDRLVGRLGERRDIVLVDQRGTGHSAPLYCDTPAPAEGLARALDRARLVAAMADCRRQLQRLPWGDLRFYTTPIAMADADAVRAALGAARIDLIGVSYGTRAALDYLRTYPSHVRRVVLDSVAPPDMVLPQSFDVDFHAALAAAFTGCATAPACARAHPDLETTWTRLRASLPREFDTLDPDTGAPLHLTLRPGALDDLVRPALYVPAIAAALPDAIGQAADGRLGALLALSGALLGGTDDAVAEGMHFSVVCAEDGPRLPAPAGAAEDGSLGLYRQVCADWPRGTVPAAFYTIPRSPAPVLLLAGGLDPVTPPRHARRVAAALGAQARVVEVPNAGHSLGGIGCLRDAVARFVDADDDAAALAVDAGCAAKLPRPPAFVPPRPARAASAPNDPHGFGPSRQPAAPSPATPPDTPPGPAPTPDAAPGDRR